MEKEGRGRERGMEKEGERAEGRNGEGAREGERKGGKERMWGRGRKTHNTYL